jgi:hypothetical protein
MNTLQQTTVFAEWLYGLRDNKARIVARIEAAKIRQLRGQRVLGMASVRCVLTSVQAIARTTCVKRRLCTCFFVAAISPRSEATSSALAKWLSN